MSEEKIFFIRRGILDNRNRKLIINSEFIEFEDRDLKSSGSAKFHFEQVADFRYGIHWLQGIYFTVGREYQIFIRSRNNEIIKINFKSYYGINKKELHKIYTEILKEVWHYYFYQLHLFYLEKYEYDIEFELCGVRFEKNDIEIKTSKIITEEKACISWNELGHKDYWSYFSLYSLKNPAKINHGYSYLNDWNTHILKTVIEEILSRKKLMMQAGL